jgi:retron-type reverse transcriptase
MELTPQRLNEYLKQHWPVIREHLLNGIYEPKPVRRVEIPKPVCTENFIRVDIAPESPKLAK